MKRLGTDDTTLIRLIVTRSEVCVLVLPMCRLSCCARNRHQNYHHHPSRSHFFIRVQNSPSTQILDWFHGFYPARVRKSLALKTLVSAAD